ncbi:MAG: DNA-directed RNA polymerase subunit beta [Candidatus Ratteibacteria bacterium]|nr:DNA-directed RNA polymerase subunit beta [Candidatus Ratteibacteria bacterium]
MKNKTKRLSFAKIPTVLNFPHLIEVQKKSYNDFLQAGVAPEKRKRQGLQAAFLDTFPVVGYDGSISLEYISYSLGSPKYSMEECHRRGFTYSAPLSMKTRLVLRKPLEGKEGKVIKEVRDQEVHIGELPLMTPQGTFIVNGAERVIVSQLHRSPGLYYESSLHPTGKRIYSVRVIPYRGSWLEFEFDVNDVLFAVIDRRRKVIATTFLRAIGFGKDSSIIRQFYGIEEVNLRERGAVDKLLGRYLADDIIDLTNKEVVASAREQLTQKTVQKIKTLKPKLEKVKVIKIIREDISIIATLNRDRRSSEEEALLDIYRRLRPGDPPSVEGAKNLLTRLFFDPKRYDLSRVGRYKFNSKLGMDVSLEKRTLRPEDIIQVMKYLINLKDGYGELDDIDHLGNRRVRSVGELVHNQFRIGLARMERVVRDRMNLLDSKELMPYNLLNPQLLSASIKDFFGRSQLSQFMDQTNPLAELTHKRRLSALGPGGLSRERAGFEVRDIHPSHYGRICPIETPEGPNIGLIASLSTYARISEFGFIETPYRKVENRKVVDKVEYLTADEEYNYVIAQANAKLDKNGKLADEKVISCYKGDYPVMPSDSVKYMDVSPMQLVSVAAALIPFLEHDDANRALMGSNMQRQSVPLLKTEVPLVGTGMEEAVAYDSGVLVIARRSGIVEEVCADKIIIRPDREKGKRKTKDKYDIYILRKFQRSNQDTCINQKPVVFNGQRVKAGEVIADGPATNQGELALGKNILVAFMPWGGYNFEDAILISEKVVKEDIYTSIHIEEFILEARETKLGKEEVTRDIPNVGEEALANLDERGVICSGAEVKSGDILVGKITPKTETELSPEEKLLRAIFGEKAEDVRDTSLVVPPGIEGIVIDTQVFSRRLRDRSEKAKAEEKDLIARIKKKYNVEIKRLKKEYPHRARELEEERNRDVAAIRKGDELPPGVLKMIKVYVATKRKLSVGDKMAGRHGNKGVIAKILPEEDMPYLPDGTPVEIVLNPLGVPSRMNLGQILETHLGWAARALGLKVASPVFDGAREIEIKELLEKAELPVSGQTVLYDGRTGEPFCQEVTAGYIYMMKLAHLVEDKMHARSIGPYSLITQQPLGGKAQFGGQRLGEMEVWALEAYGAAYTLQEMLTVKSDDVAGRNRIYETIVKGENLLESGRPESFNVLVKELQGLALNLKLLKEGKDITPQPKGRGLSAGLFKTKKK